MSLIDELRSAVRSLLRQPGVVALAVGVLALGLGVNVAVLAVAHGVLWKPLPYPDAHRLMTVAEVYEEGGPEHGARLGQLREWNLRLRTARVAGYAVRERAVRGAGQSRVLEVATVTGGFFDVVGVPARLGDVPGFAPGDAGVVISATLARMLDTGTDGPAVGQGVTIGDRRYDVAAVMPAEFAFPSEDTHVWLAPPGVAAEGSGSYRLVGRMRSGTNVARVREDATRVAREINGEEWSAAVRPVEETLRGELSRPVLLASIVAALLVLAVACANAVTLLIGRSLVRRREFGVRIALGCSRARVIRTALVEGLVVAAAGFVIGLALARAGLRAFPALAAGVLPRADAVAVDPPVLLAGGVLTLLAAGACGAASAAGAVGRGGSALLRGTAATGSRTTRTPRAWLAAGQIALSIVLLAGAGLLARTVERLLNEESGFEPQRALTARLMLADTPFVEGGAATAFVNALLERIRALPGVRAAGVGSMLPPADAPLQISFVSPENDTDSRADSITLSFAAVTAGYFAALGTPLRQGRRFEASDLLATVSPVILSETAARFIHRPHEDPVGRPMPWDLAPFEIRREDSPVVAVVADVKYQGLDAPRAGSVYVPWQRAPTGVSHLVIRTTGDPLAPTIRDLVRTLDPSLPAPEVRTLADHAAGSVSDRRLTVVPAAGFAALALAVATVGLFGTLARAVVERRRELAVRAAVGASPGRLLRHVLRDGLAVAGIGLGAGLPGAAATGRGLGALLHGVGPYDPVTFGAVAVVVLLAALAASAAPALRAARLDPLTEPRAE